MALGGDEKVCAGKRAVGRQRIVPRRGGRGNADFTDRRRVGHDPGGGAHQRRHADRERREKRLLARAGGGAQRQRPRRADRAQGFRQDRRSRRRLPSGPADLADQPSRRRASAPDRHRTDPSRLRRHPRRHAQEARRRRRGDAYRFHEDVPHGPRRRQAEGRSDRRAARMVLQGQRHDGGRARRAAALAGLRQGRRRGTRDRRHLRHRRRRDAVPRRLRARPTSSPTTSPSA